VQARLAAQIQDAPGQQAGDTSSAGWGTTQTGPA